MEAPAAADVPTPLGMDPGHHGAAGAAGSRQPPWDGSNNNWSPWGPSADVWGGYNTGPAVGSKGSMWDAVAPREGGLGKGGYLAEEDWPAAVATRSAGKGGADYGMRGSRAGRGNGKGQWGYGTAYEGQSDGYRPRGGRGSFGRGGGRGGQAHNGYGNAGDDWQEQAGGGGGNDELLGEWTDSLGHSIVVTQGTSWRGPLHAKLTRGAKEQVLSLRREDGTGRWACGNAMLDADSSTADCLIWIAYDGRRSVWRRHTGGDGAGDPQPLDLLPWLLNSGPSAAKPAGDTLGSSIPTRRRWGSIMSEDDEEEFDFLGLSGKPGVNTAVACAEGEADAASADGARVAAVLDVRQVLGADRGAQETLSYILMDHDIVRRPDEDPIVPAVDSPLWERLPEQPRRNTLQLLASWKGVVGGGCRPSAAADDFSEVHVGRHRFPVASTDVQALLRRWTGPKDSASRSAAMAHVLSLYRALDNPLAPEPQRSALQLGWDALERKRAGIEYELFASPFNASVENGHYGSRWPHVECDFGSVGSYPGVIDIFPEGTIIGVNPPFSDAYLEHLMGTSLEYLVDRFRRVHLFVPVREAPWRSQLRRLQGASFVRQFWDSTALKERPLGQPVLYWEGSELASA